VDQTLQKEVAKVISDTKLKHGYQEFSLHYNVLDIICADSKQFYFLWLHEFHHQGSLQHQCNKY